MKYYGYSVALSPILLCQAPAVAVGSPQGKNRNPRHRSGRSGLLGFEGESGYWSLGFRGWVAKLSCFTMGSAVQI